jgi:uncharacterized protein YdhG (YjbR/CyaY superfamily)
MKSEEKAPNSIDEYIAGFPDDIQFILEELRMTIRKAAPGVVEKISYRMPTFVLNGILVYFAAFKNHVGFYPRLSGIESFKKELSVYKGGKGSVQFPINDPLPLNLITEIVRFRVKENLEITLQKQKSKK